MKMIARFSVLIAAFLFVFTFIISSCESKEDSILKVYVRDKNNDLLPDAKVIIIGDTKSNPPTMNYVDTMLTDDLGVATFNMNEFFKLSGKSVTSGYFNIVVKYLSDKAEGTVRVKEHITSVQTVNFQP